MFVLREITPHNLVDTRPFWRRGAPHSALGLLGSCRNGGSAPGSEEGCASEGGECHGEIEILIQGGGVGGVLEKK